MMELLVRHREEDVVAFGAAGARSAGQLSAYARAIGAALEHVPPGARVLLACSDRYHFAAALLGAWQRGLVAVLPHYGQPDVVRALVRASGSAELLHDRDETTGLDVRTLERPSERTAPRSGVTLAPDACALVAYTSGSTGAPVPHEKTLAQLLEETGALIDVFDLVRQRVVTTVPPHHLYGLLFSVLVPLAAGGCVSRSSPLHPEEILRELEAHGGDVLVAVPPNLAALAQHAPPRPWPSLHRVFSSAAPLAPSTEADLARLGVTVTQVLGSTETGGIGYRTSCAAPWTPLPSVEVSVSEGALSVASLWASARAGERVRTADRAELVAGGFVHLGRADAVAKIGGRRVDLGDIEARLKALSGVRDARVVKLESARLRGAELCAVVEADPESVTVDGLKRALSSHFDPVTLPRRYRIVRSMPRGPSGKATRNDLLRLFDVWDFPREALEDGSVRIVVPASSGFFRGHFDAEPILPGVVQLEHIALREAKRRWPELGPLVRVTRVKFKRPIGPGEELVLDIAKKGESQVQFSMRCGSEPASSGILHFRRALP